MELNLTQIRSFLAVVDFGGYHRAADALHLSQPSVSQHVRKLEAQLGGALFERDGRGVRVTDLGDRAATELRHVADAHDRAVTRLTRADGASRTFVLGIVEHVADPFVPRLVATLREQLGPERQIQLRVERSRTLVAAVEAGEIDVALVVDATGAGRAYELGELPLHWWAHPDLPAGALPDPVPIVVYTAPCGLRDRAIGQLGALGLDHVVVAETPHLSGIQAAVRGGLGFALLAAGVDGIARVRSGPLATAPRTPLSLVVGAGALEHEDVLRRAAWSATVRGGARAAA